MKIRNMLAITAITAAVGWGAVAVSASAAPAHHKAAWPSCGTHLQATGRESLATAAARAKPDPVPLVNAVGWLLECNRGRFTARAATYVRHGNLRKPMPRGMWYWLIEGCGGLPGQASCSPFPVGAR